jgi:hypothetical protein
MLFDREGGVSQSTALDVRAEPPNTARAEASAIRSSAGPKQVRTAVRFSHSALRNPTHRAREPPPAPAPQTGCEENLTADGAQRLAVHERHSASSAVAAEHHQMSFVFLDEYPIQKSYDE